MLSEEAKRAVTAARGKLGRRQAPPLRRERENTLLQRGERTAPGARGGRCKAGAALPRGPVQESLGPARPWPTAPLSCSLGLPGVWGSFPGQESLGPKPCPIRGLQGSRGNQGRLETVRQASPALDFQGHPALPPSRRPQGRPPVGCQAAPTQASPRHAPVWESPDSEGRGRLSAPLHPRRRHSGGPGFRGVSGFEEAPDKSPRALAGGMPPRDDPPRRRRPSEGGALMPHGREWAAALAGKEPSLEWRFGAWRGGCSPLRQGPRAKGGWASQEVQAGWG